MCEQSAQTDEVDEWLSAVAEWNDGPGNFPLLTAAYLICVGVSFGVILGRCSKGDA